MKFWHGNVVLVTGASSGIGKSIAETLSCAGFTVYGTSRKCGKPTEIRNGEGAIYHLIKMDVRDGTSVSNAVQSIIEKETRIDILVNNAGIGIAGSIEDTSEDEMLSQFNTNLFGSMRVTRAVLPGMRSRRKGLIVNIGSVAGFVAIPHQAFYSASKAALESVTESLRMELKRFGVKAALIDPGDTKTEFSENRITVKALSGGSDYSVSSLSSIAKMERDERKGSSPESAARAVLRVISKKNPPSRTIVGFSYKLVYLLKKLFPSRLAEIIVGKMYA
jgi:short-subunit dehydrogenase